MSKQSKLTIQVDEPIYELVKKGRINMAFCDEGSELHKEAEKLSPGDTITISNKESKRSTLERRLVALDRVNSLYLGKGYPPAYRTTQSQARLRFDLIIKEEKNEPEPAN